MRDKARAYEEAMRETAPAVSFEGKTDAEAYLALTLMILPSVACTQFDLRVWWAQEADHRRQYGLSEAQEAELIEACKAVMDGLPEGGSSPKPQSETDRKIVFGRRTSGKKKRYGG